MHFAKIVHEDTDTLSQLCIILWSCLFSVDSRLHQDKNVFFLDQTMKSGNVKEIKRGITFNI